MTFELLTDPLVHRFGLGGHDLLEIRHLVDRPDFDLASAHSPSFVLTPEGDMYDELRRDYSAMAAMIFGDPPEFDAIVETVATVEQAINSAG